MALEDYPFRVEELAPAGELIRVMAYLDNPLIARAAFRAAVEQYPGSRIRLRNRALVMDTGRSDRMRGRSALRPRSRSGSGATPAFPPRAGRGLLLGK